MRAPSAVALTRIFVVACVLAACSVEPPRAVTPREHDLVWRSRDRYNVRADLGLGAVSRQPVDILLLFDRTASMDGVIRQAQTSAREILSDLRARYPSAAFGVASLADYKGGEIPWMLHQDLTLDVAAIPPALNAIHRANGFDYPEAYTRALFEARHLSWRPGARRYLVLFGDAPAHDPTFYGEDLGVDPGRDGVEHTADDLTFVPTVAALKRDRIVVLAIYDGSSRKAMHEETVKGFEFMAAQTGGISLPIKSAREVAGVVRQSLSQVGEPAPALRVPPTFTRWIDDTAFVRDAAGPNLFHTPVGVTAPRGTRWGIYRIPLAVVSTHAGGADTIGTSWVTVRVGFIHYPWRIPLFLLLTAGLLRLTAGHIARGRFAATRYEHNLALLRLLGRVSGAAVVAYAFILVWRYAPGTLPPPPEP